MGSEPKDRWDKADVLLKPMGGLLTAIAVAALGLIGRDVLESRQSQEADQRLYTQLVSGREQSDSSLRKDMLNSIIEAFLKDTGGDMGLEKRVLGLELLAYNFHDSLDLGPLFKHVGFQIDQQRAREEKPGAGGEELNGESWPAEQLRSRIRRVASDVAIKQLGALEDAGVISDFSVQFSQIEEDPSGIPLLGAVLRMRDGDPDEPRRRFDVVALDYSSARQEVQLLLEISLDDRIESSERFWVGFFDFPLIDNTRLAGGDRVAVVLRKWKTDFAELSLAYFPASRASLKEKPYYDEVIDKLRRLRAEEKAGRKRT